MTRAMLPRLYLVALVTACAVPVAARAQESGKVKAVDGALLARAPGQATWRPLHAGDAVPAGQLLVALPQAELISPDGAVRALMLADLGRHTPFPVLESALTLYPPEGVDLDLGLDRGIVGVTNLKEKGSARVRFRFHGQRWELTLKQRTSVGVEIYGRHAPGVRTDFHKVTDPVANVVFVVTKGEAFLDIGEEGHALQAAPGTAMLIWDNVSHAPELRTLEKPPHSLRDRKDQEAKLFEHLRSCGQCLAAGDPVTAAAKLVAADDLVERRAGVTSLGALDALGPLLDALADTRADVREQAVLVLRHWLGRGPGQLERLHQELRQRGLSEANARTVLQLLLGFNDAERAVPATYDLLIEDLDHRLPTVRELAHWHLVRLAPAGRDIPYDPTAGAEARRRAIQAWRDVIPAGQLPRRERNSATR